MELTQLKYFLCTANCGRVTRAAEILHVSQSAISTAISRLEKELDVELFRKEGRNIRLTESGARFAEIITPAVAQLDYAKNEMISLHHTEPSTILLSVEVPDFVSELERIYYQLNPDARFHQSIDTTESALEKLRCGTVDFRISYEPINSPDVVTELISYDRVLIQMSRNHPLADRDSIWLNELSDASFISFNLKYGLRRWMEGMCFLAGFRPKIRYEACDTQAMMALLNMDNAVTFIAESTWNALEKQNSGIQNGDNPIVAIPLKDAFCERFCYLQHLRNRVLSPEAREFRSYTLQFKAAMDEIKNIRMVEQELISKKEAKQNTPAQKWFGLA